MRFILAAVLMFFSTAAFSMTYVDFCKNTADTVKFSERKSAPPYGLYIRCFDYRGSQTYELFIAGCTNVTVDKYPISITAKGTTRRDIAYDVKCKL